MNILEVIRTVKGVEETVRGAHLKRRGSCQKIRERPWRL